MNEQVLSKRVLYPALFGCLALGLYLNQPPTPGEVEVVLIDSTHPYSANYKQSITDTKTELELALSNIKELPVAESVLPNTKQTQSYVKLNKIVNKITNRPPKDDVEWLATNIMFEAANQPPKGKKLVAHVTINRVGMFGNGNIKDSILNSKVDQDGLVPIGGCHFSWLCDGKGKKVIPDDEPTRRAWNESLKLAKLAMQEKTKYKYDHYVKCDIEHKTWWRKFMKPESRLRVGAHCFFEQDPQLVEANWKAKKEKKATMLAKNGE